MNNPLVEQLLRSIRMRRKIKRYTPDHSDAGRMIACFQDDLGRTVKLDMNESEFHRCHQELLTLQNTFARLVVGEVPSSKVEESGDLPPESSSS